MDPDLRFSEFLRDVIADTDLAGDPCIRDLGFSRSSPKFVNGDGSSLGPMDPDLGFSRAPPKGVYGDGSPAGIHGSGSRCF